MRESKVIRYRNALIRLKKVRAMKSAGRKEEKLLLELMAALWEGMSIEERAYFRDTNHISWPPPWDEEDEEEE